MSLRAVFAHLFLVLMVKGSFVVSLLTCSPFFEQAGAETGASKTAVQHSTASATNGSKRNKNPKKRKKEKKKTK